jgi:hypothetical protein
MKHVFFSEMSVDFLRSTWRYNPADWVLTINWMGDFSVDATVLSFIEKLYVAKVLTQSDSHARPLHHMVIIIQYVQRTDKN